MSGSAPYLLYREVSPTSSLRCSRFFRPVTRQNEDGSSGGGEYLFTAAVSAITIFEVFRGVESDNEIKLISVYHSSLYGKVQDVGIYRPRLSNTKAGYMQEEYLVLSFDDGKFCLMRFDTNTLSLEPLNIYNSQENALGAGAIVKGSTHGQMQFGGVGLEPLVIVSNEFALGCSVVYSQQLFLFPLTGSTRADTNDRVGKDGNIPFLYDIHDSTNMPGNIIDICFLENYSKPTLAVLQAAADTTIGHAKAQRHTCTLTVLALDTVSRAASKLWQHFGLPHDSLRLLSLPKSPLFQHGHVLLVTMNALLVASPDQVVGCATNGFAAVTVSNSIRMQTWPFDTGIELDGSQWLEAGPHELIGTLKDGRRLVVHLTGVLDNRSSLDYLRFGFGFLTSGPPCSCCCANDEGDMWFFGSAHERGTLEKVVRTQASLSVEEEAAIASLVVKSDAGAEHRAISAVAGGLVEIANGADTGTDDGHAAAVKVKKEELHDDEEEQEEAPPTKRAKKAPVKKPATKGKGKGKVGGKAKTEPEAEAEADTMQVEQADEGPPSSTSIITTITNTDADAEETGLYGVTLREAANSMIRGSISSLPRYAVCVVDTVTVLGPVVSAEYTHTDDSFDAAGNHLDWAGLNQPRQKMPVGSAAAFVAEREVKDSLQLGTGIGTDGAVTRAAYGRRYVKVASKNVPRASDIFSVELRLQSKPYSLVVMSIGDGSPDMESASKVMLAHESARASASDSGETEGGKTVGDIYMAEIKSSDDGDGFILDEVTVALQELAPNVVLQAVRGGIRIVRLDRDNMGMHGAGAGKAKSKSKSKGRGRSGSVGSTDSTTTAPPQKVDAAAVSADFYTLQDLRVDALPDDGGLGCPEGEYLVSSDVIACARAHSSSAGVGEDSYISLLTSGGSFFVLKYSVKGCLATVTFRQVAQPPPTPISTTPSPPTAEPVAEGDEEAMDVDDTEGKEKEKEEQEQERVKSLPPPQFRSNGDFDDLLPSASSRIVGASFYRGAFPYCAPVAPSEAPLRGAGQGGEKSDGDAATQKGGTGLYGIRTPRKTPRSAATKTPGKEGGATPTTTAHSATATAAATTRAKLDFEEKFLYGHSLGSKSSSESARGRSDSLVSVDVDGGAAATSKAAPKKGRSGKALKGAKSKATAAAAAPALMPVSEAQAQEEGEHGLVDAPLPPKISEIPLANYLVLWTSEGALFILDLITLQSVFYCQELSLMPGSISVQRFEPAAAAASVTPYNEAHLDSAHIATAGANNRRLLHHVRVCDIGTAHTKSLCIIAIALTGDLFVYRYTGNRDRTLVLVPRSQVLSDGGGSSSLHTMAPSSSSSSSSSSSEYVTEALFSKVSHSTVTRRRRNKILYNTRKLKALLDAGQERAEAAQAEDARVDGLDLESLQYIRSSIVPDPGGGDSVVVSGGTLCTIQASGGLVKVAPICLPEVHFMNAGAWALAPLAVPSLDVASQTTTATAATVTTRGLYTLWVEHDADTVQAKSQRVGLLGLYQEAPNYFSIDGSSLSFKRQVVGRTVRKTSEVTAKGDDKLEQELLSRRTSVYACSSPRSKAFGDTKVSEADRLAALALYDRYYPDMKSFLEPDAEVMGGAPEIASQSDSLVLVQEACPVSEYVLPEDEQIIDMSYCTLPVEKISQSTYFQASTRSGMVPQMTKKKVFVVVGTQVKDTHGEDSPGEGRLLLFGLDFNDFQTAEEKEVIEKKRKEEEERREAERLERERAGGDPMDIAPIPTPLFPSNFTAKSTPKLKLHWAGPGPASIVQQFGDYVISAVDNTLFVYRLMPQETELEQICFFEAKIYIKNVSVERNYVLISDFMHSVQLLVWSRDEYTLTMLGKDYNPCVGLSTSFLRDHSSMGLLVGDDEGNLQMLMYAPLRAESKDGTRLLLQADFHLGCEASVLLQHPALYTAPASASGTGQIQQSEIVSSSANLVEGARAAFKERIRQRQAALQIAPFAARMNKKGKKDNILVGTLEGAVGVLSAVEERTYRRLALMQQIMITSVRSVCALNPREFRLMKTAHFRGEKKRGVLDGTLLYQYVCMDGTMQDEIAAAMGVTADLLLDNLREIDQSAAVF